MLSILLFAPLLIFNCDTTFAKRPSVIIIGAGPAGIAAATKLLENSITNITILEAENRIGGRIHSVEFADGYVDIGAEYCHGEEGNIVYELAKPYDLLGHYRHKQNESSKIYTSKGSPVTLDLVRDFFDIVSSYQENVNVTNGVSLGEAFLERYNKTLLNKYSYDKEKRNWARDAIKLSEDLILTDVGSFSWFQPSAGEHFELCPGDQAMTWKTRGFHVVLDILMKKYPDPSQKLPIDDKIRLNKKVETIFWNDTNVQVGCTDNITLVADHVIFTPSVGVLKDRKDTLFDPQLPADKIRALDAIGFDGVMKIIFHFPVKWWKDDDMFFFLWEKEDLANSRKEFPEGPSKDGTSWIAYIPAFVNVPSNPNVFIAWASGELLPEIEKLPDDVFARGCYHLFNKFLGKDYNVTKAAKIIRSRWNSNPNFLGTYSYEKVGYFKEDVAYQNELAQPLLNGDGNLAVLFAGEATHSKHYATVQGAIGSGIREAERIIKNKIIK